MALVRKPRCTRVLIASSPGGNMNIHEYQAKALLHDYGRQVDVLLHGGERVTCASPADVVAQWEAADRSEAGGGRSHIDLLVLPRT